MGHVTSINTFGAMIDDGYTLTVYCSCGYRKELDLPAMAERLGRNHGSMHWDLVPKLRCSGCGGKDRSGGGRCDLSLQLHPPPFKP